MAVLVSDNKCHDLVDQKKIVTARYYGRPVGPSTIALPLDLMSK